MGLYEFVDNIQKKSDSAKKKILFVLVLLFFAVLVSLWFVSFKKQVAQTAILGESKEQEEGGQQKAELLGPIDSLLDGFGLVMDDIKEQADEFFAETENVLEETPALPFNNENEIEETRSIYELPH